MHNKQFEILNFDYYLRFEHCDLLFFKIYLPVPQAGFSITYFETESLLLVLFVSIRRSTKNNKQTIINITDTGRA